MLSSKPTGTKYSKEAQKMTVQDHCGWTDDQLNSTCKRIKVIGGLFLLGFVQLQFKGGVISSESSTMAG